MNNNKHRTIYNFLTGIIILSMLLTPTGTGFAQSAQPPQPAAPFEGEMVSVDAMKASSLEVPMLSIPLIGNTYQAGADRLTALQNNDGGWDWPLDDGNPANVSPRNTIGPIGKGLAEAYLHTNDADHLAALADAGALLLTKTNNFSTSDGYLAAALDAVFGVKTYTTHVTDNFYGPLAAGTYNRNGAGTLYTTAMYVSAIRAGRSGDQANMAAWDLGMGLVAAASAGADIFDWVAGVKAEIEELDGAAWYDVIGLAGAVYGLAYVNEDFDPTAGEHAAASNLGDLGAVLASYQIAESGGFAWNSEWVIPNDGDEAVQETAYAILALNELDRAAYLSNIMAAADYLDDVQLVSGGWEGYVGSGENNEITAEALWGINTAYPLAEVWVCVSGDCGHADASFNSIQSAIDAAASGATINVQPGTYTEMITLNKPNITVVSTAGPATTIIDVPGTGLYNGVEVLAELGNVTFNGFTVKNFTQDGIKQSYLQKAGTAFHVLNNIVIPKDTYLRNGIEVTGDGSTVIGNTVYGKLLTEDWASCGIQVDDASDAEVLNNTIDGGSTLVDFGICVAAWDYTIDDVLIQGNTITHANTAIGLMTGIYTPHTISNVSILSNVLADSDKGISATSADYNGSILNLTLDGTIKIENNQLTNIAAEALYLEGTLAAGAGLVVDASPNWWGQSTGPAAGDIVSDAAAIPEASISFIPWCTDAACTTFGTPTVHNVTQNLDYMTIQAAIDAAASGDSILVDAGTLNVDSTIIVNKSVTISGPVSGGAIVQGTNSAAVSVFEIAAANVTIQNLEITHNALTSGLPSPWAELPNSLIRIPTGTGMSGIVIANNKVYVPAQAGAMSTWNGVAITVGSGTVAGMSLTGNTVYNTRNGIVIHYNNSVTLSGNTIYNTKGGIMQYTGSQADADNRIMSNNTWTTAHNEWDIVWNSGGGPYAQDYNKDVLLLSGANNDAYVLSLMVMLPGTTTTVTGNRSHVFVNSTTGTTTLKGANGNINLPYATMALGIEAVVPGGKVLAASGTYTENVSVNKAVNLVGAQYDVAVSGRTAASASEATIQGLVTVNASNVNINGFTLTNPGQTYALSITPSSSNIDIAHNIVDTVGAVGLAQNVHAVVFQNGADDVSITDNRFSNIKAGAKSLSAIGVLDSVSTNTSTGVLIEGNTFTDIASATKGAYGIQFNNKAGVPGAQIKNNTFSGLSGGWTHAIGLEGPTANAVVTGNVFSGLTAAGADNAAILFEMNPVGDTVTVSNNQFNGTAFYGVAVHPNDLPGGANGYNYTVNAENNWWNAAAGPVTAPSGSSALVGPNVDFSPWCADAACTTFAALPTAFNKTTPANGATGIPTTLTFYWSASSGMTSYEYCLDTTSGDTCTTSWVTNGTKRSVTLAGLSTGTTYYWHVRARNSFGTTYANASETAYWSFTTGTPPAAFNKTSPANGATGILTPRTLYWGASSGMSSYEYCLDTTAGDTCTTSWVYNGTKRSVTLTGLSTGTTYYWHVRARNSFDTTYANGSETAYWSFTTGTPPSAFNKTSPANGATGLSTAFTLYWSASSGMTSYEYCLDTTAGDTCTTSWVTNGTKRSVALTGLSTGTTYYWHVRARNSFSTTYANGSETAYWSFTTGAPPTTFNKTSPANGATGISTTRTLYWGASSGMTNYEYCLDTTAGDTCTTSWVSNGTKRSVALTGLSTGTTYYWHVRARNSFGTTYANASETAYWSFTTVP